MDASTLESYRHHTSAMYRLVLTEQTVDADTREQAVRLEAAGLAAVMIELLHGEHSWTASQVEHELLGFLRHIGCTVQALRRATPIFRQLVVTSAVTSGFLAESLGAALLEALGGTTHGGPGDGGGAAPSMLLSTLIEPGTEAVVDGPARTGVLASLDAAEEHNDEAATQFGGSSATTDSEATQGGPTQEPLSVAALMR